MKDQSTKLGPLEMRVISWAQLKKTALVQLEDLELPLGLTRKQLKEVLSRLKRAGIIVRLTRGAYLIPTRLPPGGKWGPDRFWVLDQFMHYVGAQYQITGLEAFNRYGLSTQIPNVLMVYNTRISGLRTVGIAQFKFIKVPKGRLGGTRLVSSSEDAKIPFPTLARTLVDGIYDWDRFNIFQEAIDRLGKEAKRDPKFFFELIETTIRYGNVGTIRRVGYVLEARVGMSPKQLVRLSASLPKRSSFIPLNPTKPAKGKGNARWGIIDND